MFLPPALVYESEFTFDEALGDRVVPIVTGNRGFVRVQLPLVLAKAFTIHNAQGQSMATFGGGRVPCSGVAWHTLPYRVQSSTTGWWC